MHVQALHVGQSLAVAGGSRACCCDVQQSHALHVNLARR